MDKLRMLALGLSLAACGATYAQADKCAMVPENMRARCEMHNRNMHAASPCSGKTGAELEQCAKEQGAKAAGK